jgi:hypothetical protein
VLCKKPTGKGAFAGRLFILNLGIIKSLIALFKSCISVLQTPCPCHLPFQRADARLIDKEPAHL